VLLLLLAAPVGADARTWHGRVSSFDDGDTVKVDIAGDGTSTPRRVRITGIQAMEQSVYSNTPSRRRGECHALEATARLEQPIRRSHRRVRLFAQHASSHAKKRLRRSLSVRIGGRWRDAGEILLREGHALWLPQFVETRTNALYSRLAQEAALRDVGIWNPTYCGAGPSAGAPLRVTVNRKHTGSDLDVPGEWVRIRSFAGYPVSLAGWWLRDSGLRRYVFRPGTVLPPNGALTLRVGPGTSSGSDLHITLRNVSSAVVDLDGYRLENPPYKYVFGTNAALAPGEAMTLEVEGDPRSDTRLVKHWGKNKRILDDAGDVVRLESFRGFTLDCLAYGTARC
jgi:endonuclease YncB( thermonuclease family)